MHFARLKLKLLSFFAINAVFLLVYASSLYAYSYKIRPVSDSIWISLSKKDKKTINQIAAYIDSRDFEKAMKLSQSFQQDDLQNEGLDNKNPFFLNKADLRSALQNIILWSKYTQIDVDAKSSKTSFSDISRFVADNGFYPNIESLRSRVEKLAKNSNTPYRVSSQYFKSNPTNNVESKMYLIDSKERYLKSSKSSDSEKDKIINELNTDIATTWISSDYVGDQAQEYLEKYGGVLTHEDHVSRTQRLTWDKEYSQANEMLEILNYEDKKYFFNIINILKNSKKIRSYVKDIPREKRGSELALYAQARWYHNKNDTKKVVKILKRAANIKNPDKWWGLRLLYARELLKTKDYKDSYKIIAAHQLTQESKKYWEAQWTSGWIALRFLDRPEIAYSHFKKLYNHVKQPVTKARATYWLGMSAQASGNKELALKWYEESSKYPLYFYGQLAIHKKRALDALNSDGEIILPKDPEIKITDAYEFSISPEIRSAYVLALLGDKENSVKIFKNFITKSDSPGEIALTMRLVSQFNDHEMNSIVSRAAERKNVFFIRRKFKLVKEVRDNDNAALIHSIIKQESGFVPSALSRVGAMGYMQLMPATAKNVAKDLGVRYNKRKLSTDVGYNVKLGSHYIKKMVDRFDGSKMLAIAAYNAGPHNSDRWIREFYDPRKADDIDEVIDWIELITYSETRNYVQRIMENLIIYKYIMNSNKDNHESI